MFCIKPKNIEVFILVDFKRLYCAYNKYILIIRNNQFLFLQLFLHLESFLQ